MEIRLIVLAALAVVAVLGLISARFGRTHADPDSANGYAPVGDRASGPGGGFGP